MPKIIYKGVKFKQATMKIIAQAVAIIERYEEMGLDLTVRQLFYQFVSRGLLDNEDENYNRLGRIISKARMAGLIDWDTIVDRGRIIEKFSTWDDSEDIIDTCSRSFKVDAWANQTFYVEVWVEKDAMRGVLGVACDPWRVPYFCCRGYSSQSAMWRAAQRLRHQERELAKQVVVFYLGDHDASGIDMTRDIRERLWNFGAGGTEVNRLALNMDQIEKHDPPPNPAKMTDPRSVSYVDRFGHESWELDALDPDVLVGLIQAAIEKLVDKKAWDKSIKREKRFISQLVKTKKRWGDVLALIKTKQKK